MFIYKNLTIIGSSHISIQSINEISNFIEKNNPEIIALELDKQRLYGLLHDQKTELSLKDIKKLGIRAFIFLYLGAWVERKLGKLVGVKPGTEMKKAAEIAIKNKLPIVLIDQNISLTLKKLIKSITLKEHLRFIYDLLRGLITRKPEVKIDLRKVPEQEVIDLAIRKVKDHYPSFYKVLIEDRNNIMAKNLYNLITSSNKRILAVVGAGHLPELGNKIIEYDKK